jgi:hypothetical protein
MALDPNFPVSVQGLDLLPRSGGHQLTPWQPKSVREASVPTCFSLRWGQPQENI